MNANFKILTFWQKGKNHVYEDGFLVDKKNRIFLVSDGISPDKRLKPSQTKTAADLLLKTIRRQLLKLPKTEKSFYLACKTANLEVKKLNQKLGFWNKCDYFDNDLAGTVFSGITIFKNHFLWSFLTDCGIGHLSKNSKLLGLSQDHLIKARKYFPAKEGTLVIRKDFRNRPENGKNKTYGVFTGEEKAMAYLKTGKRKFKNGETIFLFSDGIRPYLKKRNFI